MVVNKIKSLLVVSAIVSGFVFADDSKKQISDAESTSETVALAVSESEQEKLDNTKLDMLLEVQKAKDICPELPDCRF
jgi:hypothetical protein